MITANWSKSIDIALIMLYNCSRRRVQKTKPLNTTGFENGYLSQQDYNRLFSTQRQYIGGENFDL